MSGLRHGHRRPGRTSSEYEAWRSMRRRCLYKKHKSYDRYGGRGIKICSRWEKFENFLSDMGTKHSLAHTLERKDTDGDYDPDNCVWATMKDQNNNKSNCVLITAFGKTQNLKQWEIETGLNSDTIKYRLNNGWDVADALSASPRRRKA